jgi:uncharacterized membrane protein
MWKAIKKIKPERFFIVTAILVELLLLFIIPPLQTPDELNHFYRAYQVSEGHFLPEKSGQRLGGYLPSVFIEFSEPFRTAAGNEYYRVKKQDVLNTFALEIDEAQRQFMDFPNTAYYSPVSYAPQALALFVLRQSGASVGTLYFGGKLFIFFTWLFCLFFVIRLLPSFKWLFTLLFLLPMNVYITNSYSADTVTNLLCFLLIALVLHHGSGMPLQRRHLAWLLLIGVLLVFAKIIYACLLLLLICIPVEQFKNGRRKWLFLSLTFLITFLVAWLWSASIMKYYISYAGYDPAFRDLASVSRDADYYLQKEYVLTHGSYFLKVLWNTLVTEPGFYLRSYIGGYGTYHVHLFLPDWLVIISYLVIIFTALIEAPLLFLRGYRKCIIGICFAGTFVLLLLSQHLTWNPVGSQIIDFIQGRYLTPLFPLAFLLLNNSWFKLNLRPVYSVMGFVIFLSAYASYFVYAGFAKDLSYSTMEFYCDAEASDGQGHFLTSNKAIQLNGIETQSELEHHTGRYSAMLPPQASSFSYHFKDLDCRDLVEVEAWQKGAGGVLVISGKAKNGSDFYFADKTIRHQHKDGWNKLSMTFSVWDHYHGSDAAFYVFNAGPDTVFVDDVTVRIKKFKDVVRNLMPR